MKDIQALQTKCVSRYRCTKLSKISFENEMIQILRNCMIQFRVRIFFTWKWHIMCLSTKYLPCSQMLGVKSRGFNSIFFWLNCFIFLFLWLYIIFLCSTDRPTIAWGLTSEWEKTKTKSRSRSRSSYLVSCFLFCLSCFSSRFKHPL